MTLQQILTAVEVAELLRCECSTVEDLLRRGELPGLKFGRSWIVPSEALLLRLNLMAMDEAEKRSKGRVTVRPTGVFVGNRGQKRQPPKLPNLQSPAARLDDTR